MNIRTAVLTRIRSILRAMVKDKIIVATRASRWR